ncbi:MAG: hypothetical protein CMH57_14120 [Myxococcales bacterium]|nr:hypothetical protein [Myxococcales bacterium]
MRHSHHVSRAWPLLLATLLGAAWLAPGCYTPEEMRAKAAAMPDPREEQAGKLWTALVEVADEENWEVEIQRRDDLILTALLPDESDALRKRVRCLIFKTPYAVGLNVTIKFDQRAAEEGWVPANSPELAARGKVEEEALARRIYGRWQAAQ